MSWIVFLLAIVCAALLGAATGYALRLKYNRASSYNKHPIHDQGFADYDYEIYSTLYEKEE